MLNRRVIRINELSMYLIGALVWYAANCRLLNGGYVFSHDSYYWYGLFHYLCEALKAGFFPLWNPYTHAGEPFFQYIIILALSDPIFLIAALLAVILHLSDIFYLYIVTYIAKLVIMAIGTTLFINKLQAGMRRYSFFIFFTILLSSFTINSYHQNGAFLSFGYMPFVLYFFISFMERPCWPDAIGTGYFLGITCQSYQAVMSCIFILFFLILYFVFERDTLKKFYENKGKIIAAISIFTILSSPLWLFTFYQKDFYPYLRMLYDPYRFLPGRETPALITGSISLYRGQYVATGHLGDIISLGYLPFAVNSRYNGFLSILTKSEMNMYVGAIPFLLGLVGIFKGRDSLKPAFIILMLIMVVLFKGPVSYNIPFTILFYLLYPLRAVDTLQNFTIFFLFCYFYLIVLGLNYILDRLSIYIKSIGHHDLEEIVKALFISIIFILTLTELFLYARCKLTQTTGNRDLLTATTSRIFESDILPALTPFERRYVESRFVKETYARRVYPLIVVDDNYRLEVSPLHDEYLSIVEKSFYRFRDGVSSEEKARLMGIMSATNRYVINTYSNPEFRLMSRLKTLLPDSSVPIPMLKFVSMMNKVPAAIDYPKDYLYIRNATKFNAFTYPGFYADILIANIPQRLKSLLLGVGLQPLEFYSNYTRIDDRAIIDPANSNQVYKILADSVIISDPVILPEASKNIISKTAIKTISYNPQHISIFIRNFSDGILLFREGFNRDWIARVDGKDSRVLRANYNQLAVFLKSGAHKVELVYRPLPYIIAFCLYIICNIIIIIYLTIDRIRSI